MNIHMIPIENTRFIFATNFSGNPENDRFGDARRKCSIIIPDAMQADEMADAGFKVRRTRPRPDDDPETFVPEYYVTALLKFRDRSGQALKYPPKVCLVTPGRPPVQLDEDTVGELDRISIKNVNVVLNAYEYDPVNHGFSLYIRTMYAEQNIEEDPFASRYMSPDPGDENPDELPF